MLRQWIASESGGPVGVLGGGPVGASAVRLLDAAGFAPIVIDEAELSTDTREELEDSGAEVHDKMAPGELAAKSWLASLRFVLISPGYSLDGGLARAFSEAFVYPVNELDLFSAFAGRPEVAVTGSCGKSTTAAIVAEMLQAGGRRTDLVGQAGSPILDLLDPDSVREGEPMPPEDRSVVIEVSSSQLEWAQFFAPRVGIWLNVRSEKPSTHDRVNADARLFRAQERATDWAILNQGDEAYADIAKQVPTRIMPFRMLQKDELFQSNGSYLSEVEHAIRFRHEGWSEKFSLEDWKLIGEHNRLNLASAVAASLLAGADRDAIAETISTFRPLEHRLEFVCEARGVKYINDSKATTVLGSCAALRAVRGDYKTAPIILLVGGKMKLGSWAPLAQEIKRAGVSHIVGFGGDGKLVIEALRKELGEGESTSQRILTAHSSLDKAVRELEKSAQAGSIVLLAPGCSSFDSFHNFEERGSYFKELVTSL